MEPRLGATGGSVSAAVEYTAIQIGTGLVETMPTLPDGSKRVVNNVLSNRQLAEHHRSSTNLTIVFDLEEHRKALLGPEAVRLER